MKVVSINKVRVKVFEENELREKFKLDDKQVELILKYQRTFPELLQDEDSFCIDGRILHEKLQVGAEYATWLKRRISKFNFDEGVDFTRFDKSVKAQNTYINTIEFLMTLEMAKELCMVENNDTGKEIRKYFILMEETLRNNAEWIKIREPEKQGFNEMRKYISEWCSYFDYDKTLEAFYSREANMLNEALTGMKAQDIKSHLGYKDKVTRDHLDIQINKALSELQSLNISLLIARMTFEQRQVIIKATCDRKYKDLKFM